MRTGNFLEGGATEALHATYSLALRVASRGGIGHFTGEQTAYPELYAVVGGSVPDFRGLFLRGVGGNSASLGVTQGDAIRNIYGELDWNANSGGASGPFQLQRPSVGISNVDWSGPQVPDGVIFDASRVVPTASENRPVNKAVRYLVRAKP